MTLSKPLGFQKAILIQAIGPPYQMREVWHGCWPSVMVVPNYLVTGVQVWESNTGGFYVTDGEGPLKDGEIERATGWAKGLVGSKTLLDGGFVALAKDATGRSK